MSSAIETSQVRLTLTSDKKVLRQMKNNKVLKTDAKGEYYVRQFDSKSFVFRPGTVLTVGKLVANGLFRDSAIILDDQLTGEMVPCIVKVGEYELGERIPDEDNPVTSCPICKQDCHSLPRLARHLLAKHKADRADLFNEEDEATEDAVKAETANLGSDEGSNEDAAE